MYGSYCYQNDKCNRGPPLPQQVVRIMHVNPPAPAITLIGSSVSGSATTGAWSNHFRWRNIKQLAQTNYTWIGNLYPGCKGFTGVITLELTSNLVTCCTTATSTRTINVTEASIAIAGGPDYVCQSATPSAITLSGSSVSGGARTGAWTITLGGGSLSSLAQTANPRIGNLYTSCQL